MKDASPHPKYRPDIDGLRAIAVASVVIYHAFPSLLSGGFVGVDVFFVISGFLISIILFQGVDRGSFSISDFYSRRIRRIFPAFSVVLFTVIIFGWFSLLPDEYRQLGKHAASSAGFIQNITLWRESGYFDAASETKPLLHIWSLGIEEQFYFFWPLLLWALGAWGGRYKRNLYLLAVILVFVVSFFLNVKMVKQAPVKTFFLPQFRFWEMAVGALLAWVVLYKPSLSIRLPVSGFGPKKTWEPVISDLLAFLGLAALTYAFLSFDHETIFPGKIALLPVVATAVIIYAGSDSTLNKKVLSHKSLIWFGLISYPLYLWHWPIFSFGRIISNGEPSLTFKLLAILISILLSWATVRFIERPFRFGDYSVARKVSALISMVTFLAIVGIAITQIDFFKWRTELIVARKGFEHAIGFSLKWFRGKGDWLFLGNAYGGIVAKLKFAAAPSDADLVATTELFGNLAKTGAQFNSKTVLIISANKHSVYPEHLPDVIIPSPTRYISLFLDKLKQLPNLTVYDSTSDLLREKAAGPLLYYMTDTHWNDRGAYVAYVGFSERLHLPFPKVQFTQGKVHHGDLIGISESKDFPLHAEDNLKVLWPVDPTWSEEVVPDEPTTEFGEATIVTNPSPLSDKYIWVVGDSFVSSLRQFFNSTFKEVRYVGHWGHKLANLPVELERASRKPDMIIVVRVERSF